MIKELNKKVAIAMSGGIDSSLTAALLKEEGHEVIGITMHHYNNSESLETACHVAKKLGIPWYMIEITREFRELIVNYFCQEYLLGRTPNPCVFCNQKIKFGILLDKAKSLGADYIATGHYVINEYDKKNERFLLKMGADENKDQSYFLYRLNQNVLPFILFPLGTFTKSQTREVAKNFGLKNDKKEESQEICFIEEGDYREFLKKNILVNIKQGDFVDKSGNLLGVHQGIPFYTIGQRKGLGVSSNKRKYVVKINLKQNTILLGEEEDLYCSRVIVGNLNFISNNEFLNSLKVEVKIRYNSKKSEAVISPYGKNKMIIDFETPQRAVTPGQSAVFYQKDVVLGGGIIEE